MRKLWLVVSLLVLALLGAAAAFAASALTTGTVSACATTPAQTIADNGTPIATVPESSTCATVTYTVPTETVTTTVAGTTAPATTATPTTATTTASSSPTFASETAYTQTRPAFTVKRTVAVASAAALKTAIANLQAGDYVEASTPFTVSGGGSANALVISKRLTAPAVIDLSGVKIVYTGTANYNAVWVVNVENVRIYGGDVSMSQPTVGGGACILWTASQHSMWWGFHAHGCGSSGMNVFTASPGYSYGGPVEYDDIEGEIDHFSLNGGLYDPHVEKCSGIQGANLADSNYFPFDHNRFALSVHDSACSGGGIEFGSAYSPATSPAGPIPDSNTIILKCQNLSFVSTIQTGGNCYQPWGYGSTNTDLKYVEADDLAGYAYWPGGMYKRPSLLLGTDTVEYGRASNTEQNPLYANHCTFNSESGTAFGDVQPVPCLSPFGS